MGARSIASTVARKLGHYVYLYVDPRDESIFYVGKGKNGRVLAHLRAGEDDVDDEGTQVQRRIRAIQAAGEEPRIEMLAHGLPDEETALRVEAAAIDLIGVDRLANSVRGHRVKQGRMPLEEAVGRYAQEKVDVTEPAILIRINTLFQYGMSPVELYDATRSAWKVGERRNGAEYAFAVFEGVVREVYRIEGWFPAGSTFNNRWNGEHAEREELEGRWEFVGTLAPESVRKRYLNRYVGHILSQGAQNPIYYVKVRRTRSTT